MPSHAKLARKASHRSPKSTGIQSQRGAIAPPPTTLPPGALIDNVSQAAAPTVQRDALGEQAAPVAVESEIHRAKGGGQTLDPKLQRSMGQAMGADFSHVKVHTDTTSDHLNHALQAKAFTTGSDVFFRQGEYNPSSKGGQELIAHELTHVVQQGGASIQCQSLTNVIQRDGEDVSKMANFISKNFQKAWSSMRSNKPLWEALSEFFNLAAAPENMEIWGDLYYHPLKPPALFDKYVQRDAPRLINVQSRVLQPLRDRGREYITRMDIIDVAEASRSMVRDELTSRTRDPRFDPVYAKIASLMGYEPPSTGSASAAAS